MYKFLGFSLEKIIAEVESAEEAEEDNIWKQLMEVTKIVSFRELLEPQYATDENLKRRVNIHQFSTSKKPWMEWVYDKSHCLIFRKECCRRHRRA